MPNSVENPFAVKPQRRRPSALLAGAKGLALVASLFAILVIAQAQSRRWLLERWVTGLAELPVAEQVERLLQIDALGDIAIETVTRRLAATDDSVASTAYELLREHQNAWSSRNASDLGRAHNHMIVGVEAIAPDLTGERVRWAKELLNQSLMECVDRQTQEMDEAYQAANRVLAILNPIAVEQPLAVSAASPLPLTRETVARPRLVPTAARMQSVAEPPVESESAVVQTLVALPPDTRSATLTHATPNASPIATAANTVAANDIARDHIQPVRHLTHSSLETFDTKSVIGLLGHQQAEMRDQAVEELVRRGLSNEEIRIANQLASPVVAVRLGLLESIIHRTDLDPRPWMLWLVEDSNREVRLRAISTLATMTDPAIKQALQKRLPNEHDATVIAHLRRVVDVR